MRLKKNRHIPWLELRADLLIRSYKNPPFGGAYDAKTGEGVAFGTTARRGKHCWYRDIKSGQWAGPRRLVADND